MAGSTLLTFTPVHAALGGLLLGGAAAAKLLTTGRVLGISGTLRGLVHGDASPWRLSFLLGLAAGALALSGLVPGAIESMPASFPVWRSLGSGLLVGVGAAMGNGCTSGHGICGSARLSARSLAYIATFFTTGIATSTLADTAAAVGVAPTRAVLVLPTAAEVRVAAVVAAGGVAAFAALAALPVLVWPSAPPAAALAGFGATRLRHQQQLKQKAQRRLQALELASELLSGAMFAVGLGISGMTRPTKVAGFLSVASPAWDPTLPFVIGGAVLVAMVAFQAVIRLRLVPKPLFCARFQLPTITTIDARLLGGGILFGAGWGLAGLCPGPALVAAVYGDANVLSYVGGMAAGMWAERHLSGALERRGSEAGAGLRATRQAS